MRLALAALALLLAACGHATTVRAGHRPVTMDLATTERPVAFDLSAADARNVVPTTQRASREYRRPEMQVHTTDMQMHMQMHGTALASWYGEGTGTASGERFDPGAMTFASRTMPFGSLVTFCHAGRCVTARCNDRGPFTGSRTFDLSRAAFAAIAPLGAGVVSVDWSYA